jgi:hypothetical protein
MIKNDEKRPELAEKRLVLELVRPRSLTARERISGFQGHHGSSHRWRTLIGVAATM